MKFLNDRRVRSANLVNVDHITRRPSNPSLDLLRNPIDADER